MTKSLPPLSARELRSLRYSEADVRRMTAEVYEELLQASDYLEEGNFETIHPDDLQLLFDSYDREFFGGRMSTLVAAESRGLGFRLSNRMTRAGGTTTRTMLRQPGKPKNQRVQFEIAVSTTLLFQTFYDVSRPITVTGLECKDRLEALQRVFEHELIHLLELLVWEESSCTAKRFATLAVNLFGHREMTHQLITPRERALKKFGIKTGDPVAFELDGQRLTGFVNRITKRATVLVKDPNGAPYSDGECYSKFYVPLHLLERIEDG